MMSIPHLQPVPDPDKRRLALDLFAQLAELPRVERFVQRGREPESARYTMEMADGRSVRVGTIKVLWSQAEMGKVLAVTIGCVPPPIEAKDWRKVISAIINHAVDVDEAPGETFADTVRDWLGDYTQHANSTDINACAAAGKPYVDDDWLHINATRFAVFIRQRYNTAVKDRELREALTDLGFERRTVHYTRSGKRSTTSFYVAPLDNLDNSESGKTPETAGK